VRLDVTTNLNATQIDGGGSFSGLKQTALQPPTGGVLFTNEEMIHTDLRDQMMLYESAYDINNPLITQDAVTRTDYRRQATVNAGLDIDIPWVEGLVFRTAGSYFWEHLRNDLWDDGRTNDARTKQGPWGERNNREKFTWQVTNTLSYRTTINEMHNFNALIGQETWYTESMRLDNTYLKFPQDNFGLNNVSMAGDNISESDKQRNGIASVFGRLMYNYADKYLVTTTIRGDGSSKFARGNQWGILPSVSGAWIISEEHFMKENISFINNLKLRGGYGVTGNCNIDNNMYVTDYQGGRYFIGSSEIPALRPQSTLGNPGLVWEQTKSTSAGLDISLFKSRVNLSLDYYNNTSDNLLIKQSIAKSSGYNDQFQNIGSIRNRGFEFVLNTVNLRTSGGFEWRSDLNMSFNKSKVLSLYGDPEAWMKVDVDSRMELIVREGEPLGQFYGYKYAGIYTTDDFNQNTDGTYSLKNGVVRKSGLTAAQIAAIKPGDIKFEDVTGQTDEAGNPVWSDADRTVIGNAEPLFFGGFNNTFAYKGFDLTVFMNFSYGNDVFNMNTQRYVGPYFANQNATANMINRFVLVDPATGKESTDLTRLAELNPNQYDNRAIWSLNAANKDNATVEKTDYNIENGSYLRISNVTLGYTLPTHLVRKASINSARVYVTANNLYTFTNYTGFDPDVSSESTLLKRGIDNSAYPRTSSYVVGVNLTF
jgi:TonB-linked SusC/RagA family outer membrane protein